MIVKDIGNVEVNKQCKKEDKFFSKFSVHSLQIWFTDSTVGLYKMNNPAEKV